MSVWNNLFSPLAGSVPFDRLSATHPEARRRLSARLLVEGRRTEANLERDSGACGVSIYRAHTYGSFVSS